MGKCAALSTLWRRKGRTQADGDRRGRWNCQDCKSSFNVLSGTIFEKTKLPLQKWFLALGLVISAKKSLSSHQLARDLELNQKSAWFMQQRIRAQMASEQGPMLQGLIEADETYVGGKPRKANRAADRKPAKRGRGAENKIKVLGVSSAAGRSPPASCSAAREGDRPVPPQHGRPGRLTAHHR